MKFSKYNQNIFLAVEKGYEVVNGEVISPFSGKPRKLHIDTRGYYRFTIRNNENVTVSVNVHRLVAYQKYGDDLFEEGIEVRHRDGNQLNNLDENILIGTHSQNMMDKPKEQRIIDAGNHSRKHPHKEIIEYYKKVKSYKKVMEKFKISSKGTISFIINSSLSKKKK